LTAALRVHAIVEPTDTRRWEDSMDLVVVAVVLALAALSFVWLDFVERA